MYYLIIALSLVLAGELEVEGNLNVTGDINSPTIDALSSMKPERVYRYIAGDDGSFFTLTVPDNKLWRIEFWGGANYYSTFYATDHFSVKLVINGFTITLSEKRHNSTGTRDNYNAITLVGGDTISNNLGNEGFMQGGLTIYEYPISGSGTDQGMDYVEP